jgi:hypothetical protein
MLERTVANFIARHRAAEALLASFRHYLRRRKAASFASS